MRVVVMVIIVVGWSGIVVLWLLSVMFIVHWLRRVWLDMIVVMVVVTVVVIAMTVVIRVAVVIGVIIAGF